ncbi:2,3-diketo-5-methylthio-1-phosphopentane phosphatase [Teratosphaeria nubilosa]|uniref:2,3-diketo-5-methylthio-1-phosphopentane phosphatase n=1 Tax=Teratosphaeria nubilosa TaxID=161662 RepID=A0A6G1L317_9PEZI|nr:2,3-diketo-5-methylthio-1-phosphopentane phosphatase [Teratosphaeria nubilosa]
MEGVRYVLLDIEGTVCPISFVKDTLFPYAIKALPDVLASKWDDEAFKPYRDAFPEEHRKDPNSLQAHAEDLTKRDVKIAYHKNLQGFLWEEGYRSEAYSTPLFTDVAPRLKQWKETGVQLAIYSSGSIFAQRLLFEHVSVDESLASKKRTATQAAAQSEEKPEEPSSKRTRTTSSSAGQTEDESSKLSDENNVDTVHEPVQDLTLLMSGWFDTTNAGLKSEAASYKKIVETLKWPPSQTLFLSDNVKEIDAATEAGLKAVLVDRPGNAPVSNEDRRRMQVVESLDEITLAHATKEVAANGTNADSVDAAAAF